MTVVIGAINNVTTYRQQATRTNARGYGLQAPTLTGRSHAARGNVRRPEPTAEERVDNLIAHERTRALSPRPRNARNCSRDQRAIDRIPRGAA